MKAQNKKIKISLISLALLPILLTSSPLFADSGVSIQMSDGTIATDIKDIKAPLYFPINWKLRIVIGLVIFLLAIAVAIYSVIKKSAANAMFAAPLAHEIAYKAIEDLRSSGLIKNGLVKEYFFRLSFIVRQYLENRFRLRAAEMTTEEFLAVISRGEVTSPLLNQQIKGLLKNFLEKSDMVKFAKYGPTADEILSSLAAAKQLVDQTKEDPSSLLRPCRFASQNEAAGARNDVGLI